jgi:hypothetical protein
VFKIKGFATLHLILVICMCTAWVVLAGLTALAFWRGKIFFASAEDVLRDGLGLPDPAPAPAHGTDDPEKHGAHGLH